MQATTIWALALAGLAATTVPAQAADVGVSIGISQPGVYGRIDIGRFPQPELIVQQPVIISRPYFRRAPEPVYLWVPPGHQKNWRQHCGQYNACGRPVYFVQDNWYRDRGPGRDFYHGDRGDYRGDNRGDYRGDNRGDGRDERHDDRGEGRGRGHDNGKGHGNGKGRD
jgi:hypothetical protein